MPGVFPEFSLVPVPAWALKPDREGGGESARPARETATDGGASTVVVALEQVIGRPAPAFPGLGPTTGIDLPVRLERVLGSTKSPTSADGPQDAGSSGGEGPGAQTLTSDEPIAGVRVPRTPTPFTLQSDSDLVSGVVVLAGAAPGDETAVPAARAVNDKKRRLARAFGADQCRTERAYGALTGRLPGNPAGTICLVVADYTPEQLAQFVEALLLAAYRYDPARAVDPSLVAGTSAASTRSARSTRIAASSGSRARRSRAARRAGADSGSRAQSDAGRTDAATFFLAVRHRPGSTKWQRLQDALDVAQRRARAVWAARDLANTPASVKSPEWLADQAVALTAHTDLRLTRISAAGLARRGFGGMLAVAAGSSRDPVMLKIEYRPPRDVKSGGHVVLVGKGITFDTGGLDLKPLAGMPLMKTDMAGSAAVLAAMLLIAASAPPTRVTALLMVAENSIDGSSYRPGDVIRHYGGRTSEVTNTDAEGRLVLADGLAHAVRDLEPTAVLDIATLTGAATLGLGRGHAAAYVNDVALGRAVLEASDCSGDGSWLMPLAEEYEPMLRSSVADARNAVTEAGEAGSITAALFLQQFVGDVPWVHLDIAGPARAESDLPEAAKGATGYGVRLIADWVSIVADSRTSARRR